MGTDQLLSCHAVQRDIRHRISQPGVRGFQSFQPPDLIRAHPAICSVGLTWPQWGHAALMLPIPGLNRDVDPTHGVLNRSA